MIPKHHLWWQKAKKPLEIIVMSILIAGLIVLITVVILGTIFQWNWTGFGPETSEPKQHAKTLWDWLQLLIIPVVLAIGGYIFNLTTSRNEQKSTQLRDQTERDIASDNQRETILQTYIDNMSGLLLDRKLRESTEDDEVQKIARVRTLTVLPRLDNTRKRSVLQFLYESDLLDKNKCILNLSGADLKGTNLSEAVLRRANLSRTNLNRANLNEANLNEANLSRAILNEASLNEADLNEADLSNADLSQANLNGANLNGADLSNANLSRVNLKGANLNEAILRGATLSRAILKGASLDKAILSRVGLNNADLSRATLSRATLRGTDLTGACLTGADLSEADLTGTCLTGADLSEANLTGTTHVTKEQLDKAKSLQKATMPNGSTYTKPIKPGTEGLNSTT